jgi:hypothetical protein
VKPCMDLLDVLVCVVLFLWVMVLLVPPLLCTCDNHQKRDAANINNGSEEKGEKEQGSTFGEEASSRAPLSVGPHRCLPKSVSSLFPLVFFFSALFL